MTRLETLTIFCYPPSPRKSILRITWEPDGLSPATLGYCLNQGGVIKLLRHDVWEWIDDRRALRFRDEHEALVPVPQFNHLLRPHKHYAFHKYVFAAQRGVTMQGITHVALILRSTGH